MALRFEFDPVNKILLLRIDGPLTEELLLQAQPEIRKHSTETDARSGMFDFSAVTEFALSTAFIRLLAKQEPSMADAATRPRIIIAPTVEAFGLSRMFQIMGEETRPLLQVVRSLEDVLSALGAHAPHFESLD
jgi:hypothetical protein